MNYKLYEIATVWTIASECDL